MLLQDIGNHTFEIDFQDAKPEKEDLIMAMDGANICLNPETEQLYSYEQWSALSRETMDYVYAFCIDGKKVFLPEKITEAMEQKLKKIYVRDFSFNDAPQMQLAGATAMHLYSWYKTHRYCGCCGSKNQPDDKERALRCKKCGHLTFPVICPAIICGVIDGDRILLTRSAHRKAPIFSLVAGYTEIGETLEQTCAREVFEEVGVHIKNIRPFINQPWGFSSSLMMGFFAELDGSPEITIQEEEIAEARWFTREEMPITENPIDITHYMMELWRTRQIP